MKSFYDILGVDKTANEGTIKKAFRKLAVKYHPDKNQGDADAADRFKEVSEANEALSDPEKRSVYDHQNIFGGQGGQGTGDPMMDDFMNMFRQSANIFEKGLI